MKRWYGKLLTLAAVLTGTAAHAHVSITSGPAFAGQAYQATFGVGHGCDGADTWKVEVHIPSGVVGVRPTDSVFGKATVVKDATSGQVTSVIWTKAATDVLPEDSHAYALVLRATLPDAPFTRLFFPTFQTCRKADGTDVLVKWEALTTEHDHDGEGDGAAAGDPAPSVFLLPLRSPGWNRYTVPEHVHDLSVFSDAQIVWAGDAAYSPNPTVQELIGKEANTQPLSEIHPGTEIWVKY